MNEDKLYISNSKKEVFDNESEILDTSLKEWNEYFKYCERNCEECDCRFRLGNCCLGDILDNQGLGTTLREILEHKIGRRIEFGSDKVRY